MRRFAFLCLAACLYCAGPVAARADDMTPPPDLTMPPALSVAG